MFILSSISRGLEFWSVNFGHTSMYENSELRSFENINFLGEIKLIVDQTIY